MPRLVVGALVDQGRLARITLPDGAEVLRSTAAGSLEQLAVRLDDDWRQSYINTDYLSIQGSRATAIHGDYLSMLKQAYRWGVYSYEAR